MWVHGFAWRAWFLEVSAGVWVVPGRRGPKAPGAWPWERAPLPDEVSGERSSCSWVVFWSGPAVGSGASLDSCVSPRGGEAPQALGTGPSAG